MLRAAYRVLHARSEEPTPIDSQTVKTTEMGGERGCDGGKKIKGRKRHITVDTMGLVLAVVVTSAAVDDAAAAPVVLEQLHERDYPRLEVVWADSKYYNHALNAWLAKQLGVLELATRLLSDGAEGHDSPIPRDDRPCPATKRLRIRSRR